MGYTPRAHDAGGVLAVKNGRGRGRTAYAWVRLGDHGSGVARDAVLPNLWQRRSGGSSRDGTMMVWTKKPFPSNFSFSFSLSGDGT